MALRTIEYQGFTLKNRTGGKNDWFISLNGRVRWGTLAEVKEDADHAIIWGHLPCKVPSWA